MSNAIKKVIKQFEHEKEKLSVRRDALRDLELEVSSLADDCDEALQHIQDSADALSRIVQITKMKYFNIKSRVSATVRIKLKTEFLHQSGIEIECLDYLEKLADSIIQEVRGNSDSSDVYVDGSAGVYFLTDLPIAGSNYDDVLNVCNKIVESLKGHTYLELYG